MERVREFFKNYYFEILLFFTIFLGFLIRFLHTSKGLPYLYNWDEPQIASNALKIMKTGDFNPHFFHYGSLLIYLNLIVDVIHYLFLMSQPYNTITSPNDIKIFTDTNWNWTISHPEFYHWNRIVTVIFATLSIVLIYKITKVLTKNKWVALVSTFFLSILQIHINYSIWVTNDVPLSFFILLVIYFLLLFLESGEEKYFYYSLIGSGLGITTKYNGGVVLVMPLIALLISHFKKGRIVNKRMWLSIIFIPALVFIIVMPYAVIDLPHFLTDVGFEIRNYKVLGPFAKVTPGFPHFFLQLKNFYINLGLPSVIVSLIGIYGIFKRENGLLRFTFIYPVVYMYFMCNTKMSYQRNFVQMYPFIAILFGLGVLYLYKIFNKLPLNFKVKKEKFSLYTVILLISLILLPKAIYAVNLAIDVHNFKDSRTRVIDVLNKMDDVNLVVFAKELRVHEYDLRRLKKKYEVIPLLEMSNENFNGKKVVYVVPQELIAFFPERCYKELFKCRKFLMSINRNEILKKIDGFPLRLDIYSISPGIFILKDIPHQKTNGK